MKRQSSSPDKGISSKGIELTAEYYRDLFKNSADIQIKKHKIHDKHKNKEYDCLLIFSEVMVDDGNLNGSITQHKELLVSNINKKEVEAVEYGNDELQLSIISPETTTAEEIAEEIFSGMVLVLFEEQHLLFMYPLPNIPQRSPEEPTSEISFLGPRDGFTEDISVNIALVRKRYKTASLVNESFEIGRRGKTKISLLYVSDITNEEIIHEVKKQLNSIQTDMIISTSDLEQILAGKKYKLVPLFNYTGRPDYVVASIDNGRFAILIDGSPLALIGPANLTYLLKTAEDRYNPYYYTNFEMLFRFVGLLVAIFLPAFFIAITSFHLDQLPFPFLATITVSRMGLPLSPQLEAFFVLLLFEVFKGAGVTLPKAVGQTLTVVGGLIIGDAAIRGGLTSPTMLVVAGITSVSAYVLINQSLATSVSIVRLIVLFLSSILGLFGFFLGVFSVVLYLSRIQVLGVPYLAPVSPFSIKDFIGGLFSKPYVLDKKRSSILKTKDRTK
ncbi:spore germination protein [Cytobacillus horneckiae]|uniref:spore germination protein n=1 Tax=Cytobacillus horneckiae TaxID=549687 RepID=UPI0039A2225F